MKDTHYYYDSSSNWWSLALSDVAVKHGTCPNWSLTNARRSPISFVLEVWLRSLDICNFAHHLIKMYWISFLLIFLSSCSSVGRWFWVGGGAWEKDISHGERDWNRSSALIRFATADWPSVKMEAHLFYLIQGRSDRQLITSSNLVPMIT